MADLNTIPGIGASLAQDLNDLGYEKVSDLIDADTQEMYEQLCSLRKAKIDRCVLYTFRCAVYYASNKKHDAKKLKWWAWKDRE
jgi:hypothetical protein